MREVLQAAPKTCTMSHRGDCVCACECERFFRLRQRHALCHTGASVCASMSARGAAGCAKDMHYVTTTVYALNRVLGGRVGFRRWDFDRQSICEPRNALQVNPCNTFYPATCCNAHKKKQPKLSHAGLCCASSSRNKSNRCFQQTYCGCH